MSSPARDTLLETALTLFHRDGFHATGIDRILAESGVSKMTLYKHFRSKDELIVAVLDLRDQRFRVWLETRTAQLADTPKLKLEAAFDALAEWLESPNFHGCLFINASAEYGQPGDPIHQAAAHHKRLVLDWLKGLAAQAGISDPLSLAWTLLLVMEGAIVAEQVMRDGNAIKAARTLARTLVNTAT